MRGRDRGSAPDPGSFLKRKLRKELQRKNHKASLKVFGGKNLYLEDEEQRQGLRPSPRQLS